MPDKVSLLTRAYEGFACGDFGRTVEEFADDIRWYMPAAEGLPANGVFHGKDEVRWMLGQIKSAFGDALDARPFEFLDAESAVTAIGYLAGDCERGALRVPYATIWRFNADGLPNRAMTFFDTATVLRTLRDDPPASAPYRPVRA